MTIDIDQVAKVLLTSQYFVSNQQFKIVTFSKFLRGVAKKTGKWELDNQQFSMQIQHGFPLQHLHQNAFSNEQ